MIAFAAIFGTYVRVVLKKNVTDIGVARKFEGVVQMNNIDAVLFKKLLKDIGDFKANFLR